MINEFHVDAQNCIKTDRTIKKWNYKINLEDNNKVKKVIDMQSFHKKNS